MTHPADQPTDESMVRVTVQLRRLTVEMCELIAQERGLTRAQVLREALTHGVARQHLWWQRAQLRRQRAEFEAEMERKRDDFEALYRRLEDDVRPQRPPDTS